MNDHIQWLEKNNLLEAAKAAVPALKKVFTECLGAKDEEVLIVGDQGFQDKRVAPILSGAYYLAAKELNLIPKIVLQEPKYRGEEADKQVIEAFYDLRRKNITVLALSHKLGSIIELGKSFRTYSKENMHRFVSTLSLGHLNTELFPVLIDSIDIDYAKLAERGKLVKEKLDAADEVHITTEAGTDLYYNIKGKEATSNIGNYNIPGRGGNIPAGEVYVPPKWKNVEGTVIIDGSSANREGTVLIKEPIKLTIKKDEITGIQGGEEAKLLEATLDWAHMKAKFPWGVRRIGELGIGINEKAKIIGTTIIDEKTLNTAHIGIGSNYWFGGTIYAIIHLDQIFKNPRIELDGKLLEIK